MGKPKKTKKERFRKGKAKIDRMEVIGTGLSVAEMVGGPTLPKTRGALLQRQKLEWKKIRSEVNELKRQRMMIVKSGIRGKEAKKEYTQEIKDLVSAMKVRHEKELKQFDQINATDSMINGEPIVPSSPNESALEAGESMDLV